VSFLLLELESFRSRAINPKGTDGIETDVEAESLN
jgi:hypothetical protein